MDLSSRVQEIASKHPTVQNIPVFGVIKEIAPTAKVATDEALGVGEFQSTYWGDKPLYLDVNLAFYQALGDRKLPIFKTLFRNPFALYRGYKDLGERMKNKKIDGNLAGEGFVQGGVMIVAPGGVELVYEYKEETGSLLPLDEIEQAILKLSA